MGRTAASRTSMTRLDFSSITPIRIHVLYWVSMMNIEDQAEDRGRLRGPLVVLARAARS